MARPNIGYGRDARKMSANKRLEVVYHYLGIARNHAKAAKWLMPEDEEADLKCLLLDAIDATQLVARKLQESIGRRGDYQPPHPR